MSLNSFTLPTTGLMNYDSSAASTIGSSIGSSISSSASLSSNGSSYFMNPMQNLAVDPLQVVFIGDLSFFCNEADLQHLLEPFGNVLSVSIRRGKEGKSLLHGFAIMSNSDEAQFVCSQLNGVEFMGRHIKVNLSMKQQPPNNSPFGSQQSFQVMDFTGGNGQQQAMQQQQITRVHFSFISKETRTLISETVLKSLFSCFGPIADISIKKHSNADKRQFGYGFVFFYQLEDATLAQKSLKGRSINGITFDCHVDNRSNMPQARINPPPSNQSGLSNMSFGKPFGQQLADPSLPPLRMPYGQQPSSTMGPPSNNFQFGIQQHNLPHPPVQQLQVQQSQIPSLQQRMQQGTGLNNNPSSFPWETQPFNAYPPW